MLNALAVMRLKQDSLDAQKQQKNKELMGCVVSGLKSPGPSKLGILIVPCVDT